jgi:hypothetical protein
VHRELLCFLLAVLGLTISSNLTAWPETRDGANGTRAPIKLLKVDPVKGYIGDPFTLRGDGLPAGKSVEFFWSTVDAAMARMATLNPPSGTVSSQAMLHASGLPAVSEGEEKFRHNGIRVTDSVRHTVEKRYPG